MVQHKRLPYGSFCICFRCWAYVQNEENEITRHLKGAHGLNTGRGHNLYASCRLVPEQVAIDLAGEATVNQLNSLSRPDENPNPRTPWANVQEIRNMYQARGMAVPAFVQYLQLPPTGDINTVYTVTIPAAGAAAVAAPAQPSNVAPASAAAPAAPAQPSDVDPQEESHPYVSQFEEMMQELEDSRQQDEWREEEKRQRQV